jgi:hypothetical protein
MKLPCRNFLYLTASAAGSPVLSHIAKAQAYPSRPVRIIVTTAAGSAMDLHGRLHGQWLSERLGHHSSWKTGREGVPLSALPRPYAQSRRLHAPASPSLTHTEFGPRSKCRDIAAPAGGTHVFSCSIVHNSL